MSLPIPPAGLSFGFSSLGCSDLDLTALRALAVRHGSRFVELRGLGGSMDLVAQLSRHRGGAAGAREFLREADVQIALVGTSFLLTRAAEAERAALADQAAAGETLGARWLRVFGGGEWGDPLDDAAADTARAHREWWSRLRAERGWRIDLILELHDAFSGTPQVLELFARTGGSLPLLWDSHHTWKLAGEEPTHTWTSLGEHVRHVHVKDSVSVPSDHQPYTYVAPGQGEFPTTGVLSLLDAAGFGGVVSLEWERHWHPALAPLDTVLPDWNRVTAPFRRSAR